VITVVLLVTMLVLMVLRVPVSISMGLAAVLALVVGDYPLDILPRMIIDQVDSFSLLAVPFFIFAGNLMNHGGATERIFDFALKAVGWLRGGLAHVSVVASIIFAGMSGAALADLAGLGAIAVRAMRANGYTPDFAIAVTLAACVIAPIVPPSIVMVIYALATDVSVGRLFLAGVTPGVLVGLCLMVYIYLRARAWPQDFAPPETFDLCALWHATRRGCLAVAAPPLILGVFVMGWTTVSEIGAVAAAYALFLGLIYRALTWKKLWVCLVDSTLTTGIIMYMVAVSAVMGWVITSERVLHDFATSLGTSLKDPLLALLVINIFLLIVGVFLETLPALLICASILLPVVKQLGIDPVHFGVIICFNLILGIIHPPVGIGLFVGARIAEISVERTFRAVLPFFFVLLGALVLINLFPMMCLWLPNLVFGAAR
jgi:tripartite ATP-independent transporter DctM subunit